MSGWGRFEEISDPGERFTILEAFGERITEGPLRARQNLGRPGEFGAGETVYRIVLQEVTGRAESWRERRRPN